MSTSANQRPELPVLTNERPLVLLFPGHKWAPVGQASQCQVSRLPVPGPGPVQPKPAQCQGAPVPVNSHQQSHLPTQHVKPGQRVNTKTEY